MVTNGNDFSNMLINVKGNCPNCGTSLTFMSSAQLAKENNISEDAVMCYKCYKVYTVNITPQEMTFLDDITPVDTYENQNIVYADEIIENNSQNEIIRPKYNSTNEKDYTINNMQQNSQTIQQEILSNNQPTQHEGDKSLFSILFYKRDKKTQEYRISKTKTISILVFLLVFIISVISDLMFNQSIVNAIEIFASIIVGIIFGLIAAVPTFTIGYLISYFLDKNTENQFHQNNQMQNQQYMNNIANKQYNQHNQNIDYNHMQYKDNPQSIPDQQYNHNTSYTEDSTQTQSQSNMEYTTNDSLQTDSNVYYEKDNMGSRHDTVDMANGYWLGERLHKEEKDPFILFMFNNPQDAEEALLEQPYIHKAVDTGKLICDDIYVFGYYKVDENNYEAIVCGKDLTYDEFVNAEESFIKYGGTRKNCLEPEKMVNKTVYEKSDYVSSVKFREKFNKDKYTYECYDADTKADALDFLKNQEVSKGLYYICVYTPEGDFGRDINGIYQM